MRHPHLARPAVSRRLLCVTATSAIMIVALAAACAGGTPDGAHTGASDPPASSGAPTPSADPRAQIKAMVDAAALRPADLGVAKPRREETTFALTMPCAEDSSTGTPQPGTSQPATPATAAPTLTPVAAHFWYYTGAKVDILSHSVYGYYPEPGTAVIGEVRAALRRCTTWIWADTFTMKVLEEFSVRTPAGVDSAAAYCHQGTILVGSGKGDKVFICDALVSRDGLVAKVDTVKLTLAAAQNEVRKALPLAAAALVKATS